MNDYYPPHDGAVVRYGDEEKIELPSQPSPVDLEEFVQQLIRMAGAGE